MNVFRSNTTVFRGLITHSAPGVVQARTYATKSTKKPDITVSEAFATAIKLKKVPACIIDLTKSHKFMSCFTPEFTKFLEKHLATGKNERHELLILKVSSQFDTFIRHALRNGFVFQSNKDNVTTMHFNEYKYYEQQEKRLFPMRDDYSIYRAKN